MYLDGGRDGVEIRFWAWASDRVEDSSAHKGSVEEAWVWI